MTCLCWLGKAGLMVFLCVGAPRLRRNRPLPVQLWAADMFDHTSHDFGPLARGDKVEHRFRVENKFLDNVHIASVQSDCDGVTVHATRDSLKTWERAEIVVGLDSEKFSARKDATIRVKFDAPFAAVVDLHVRGETRGEALPPPAAVEVGCGGHCSGVPQCARSSTPAAATMLDCAAVFGRGGVSSAADAEKGPHTEEVKKRGTAKASRTVVYKWIP